MRITAFYGSALEKKSVCVENIFVSPICGHCLSALIFKQTDNKKNKDIAGFNNWFIHLNYTLHWWI